MFILKKYRYIFLFIQLIFSFLFFLPQTRAYEHDIYYYPLDKEVDFGLINVIHKDSAFYFNDLNKQYLDQQTPYSSLPPKANVDKVEPKKENIQSSSDEEQSFSKIAIIIDDMGINRKRSQQIADLKYPLTVSFLPYAPQLKEQIEQSQNSGQEIMLHIPMEPKIMQNYTKQMLTVNMTDEEIAKILDAMLQKVPQAVGINNHMGSKFTEDRHRMGVVMQKLAEKDLFFVDSRTTAKTQGYQQAQHYKVQAYMRNVFLDNKNDYDYILLQLQETEKIAHEKGYAIAIGHPKEQTYKALKDWLPSLEDKGFKLLPISKIKKD